MSNGPLIGSAVAAAVAATGGGAGGCDNGRRALQVQVLQCDSGLGVQKCGNCVQKYR